MKKLLLVVFLYVSKLYAMDLQLTTLPSQSELQSNRLSHLLPKIEGLIKYFLIRNSMSCFVAQDLDAQSALPSETDFIHHRFTQLPRDVQELIRRLVLRNNLPLFINPRKSSSVQLNDVTSFSLTDDACFWLIAHNGTAYLYDVKDSNPKILASFAAKYVALTADARSALASDSGRVSVYDLTDKSNPEKIGEFKGNRIVVTPDGRYALTENNSSASLYDLTDCSKPLMEFPTAEQVLEPESDSLEGISCYSGLHNPQVIALDLSPDAHFALIATPVLVRLWDIRNKQMPVSIDIFSYMSDLLKKLDSFGKRVNSACMSADGRTFLLGKDHHSELWELTATLNPQKIATLLHPSLGSVSIAPDAQYALTGSDKELEVWDLSDKKKPVVLKTFKGTSRLKILKLTPDARLAVAAGKKSLDLWALRDPHGEHSNLMDLSLIIAENKSRKADLKRQAEQVATSVKYPQKIRSIDLTDDARYALVAHDWSRDLMDFVDRTNPTVVARFSKTEKLSNGPTTALTPDGRFMILVSNDIATCYDLADKSQPRKLSECDGKYVVLTPDARYALTISDTQATLYNPLDGSKIMEFPIDIETSSDGICLALASDANTAIIGSAKRVRLWDLTDKKNPSSGFFSLDQRAYSVCMTPDARFALFRTTYAELWDISDRKNPKRVSVLSHSGKVVFSSTMTPDARFAVTADVFYNGIKVWDLIDKNNPQLVGKFGKDEVRNIKITADARYILASRKKTTELWPLIARAENVPLLQLSLLAANTNKERPQELLFDYPIESMSVTDNYALIATKDSCSYLFDCRDKKRIKKLCQIKGTHGILTSDARFATVAENDSINIYDLSDKVHPKKIGKLNGQFAVFTRDAQHVLIARANDVTLYDVKTLEAITTHHVPTAIMALDITPDAHCALIASYGTVLLWNLRNIDKASILKFPDLSGERISLSSDARYALVGSHCSDAQLWDLTDKEQPKCSAKLKSPFKSKGVRALTLSSDGQYALTADSSICVWDVTDKNNPILIDMFDQAASCVKVTPDGRYIFSSSAYDNTVKMWPLNKPQRSIFMFNQMRKNALGNLLEQNDVTLEREIH